MVNLVESVGQDPAPCLDYYQPWIKKILNNVLNGLASCITGVNTELGQ